MKKGTKDAKALKKRLITVAIQIGLVLLLLIPTYLAVASYYIEKNAPPDNNQSGYVSLELTGPKGITASASPTENDTLFSMITALLSNGTETVSLPETSWDGVYQLAISRRDVTENYTLYFSGTTADCYYTSTADPTRTFLTTGAATFLNSPFAFELYDGAVTPILTTAATDEILPTTVSWHYRTQQGTFTALSGSPVADSVMVYPIANDIGFYFSIQPSQYEVVIKRAGTEVHRSNGEDISLPLLVKDEVLDFEINAIYNQDSRLDYYGSITYRFQMRVVEAARFTLTQASIPSGGFFLIRCENVHNTNKLQISATPALEATPTVFEHGNYVYVAVPANEKGTKLLQVTYGTVASAFQATVTKATETAHVPAADTLRGDWVTLLSGGLSTLINTKGAASATGNIVPTGNFLAPGGTMVFGFGDTVTVADTALENAFIPFELYQTSGAVTALSVGYVAETGEDSLLGKYVIVNHGCGIYTWYCGLSDIRVSVGAPVGIGDTLGTAGRSGTGLFGEDSVLLLATLGKTAISPAYLRSASLQIQ